MKKMLTLALVAMAAITFTVSCSDDKDDDNTNNSSSGSTQDPSSGSTAPTTGVKFCGYCNAILGTTCQPTAWICQEIDETFYEGYCTSTMKGKVFASEAECEEFTPTAPAAKTIPCRTDASSMVGENCFMVAKESDCTGQYQGTVVESCD